MVLFYKYYFKSGIQLKDVFNHPQRHTWFLHLLRLYNKLDAQPTNSALINHTIYTSTDTQTHKEKLHPSEYTSSQSLNK